MSKLLPLTLAFIAVTALTTGSAFAEDMTPPTPAANAPASNASAPAMDQKDFATRKAEMLNRLNERLTKMQKMQTCITAANDFKAMRECRPNKEGKESGNAEHKPM